MELDTINTLIAATIPLIILFIGYRLERQHKNNKEAKQKEQDILERKHKARIQYELDGRIFGPHMGRYIAEISVILHNKGLIRNIINELHLTVRTIDKDAEPGLFIPNEQKGNINLTTKFPNKIIDTDMLWKKNENDGFFVEPGIEQRFTYIASIPENTRFILVRSSFRYHEKSKHSVQRVFDLKKETEKIISQVDSHATIL